jgi:hypothetical protein
MSIFGTRITNLSEGNIKLTQPKLLAQLFEEYQNDIDYSKSALSPH